MADRIVVMNAGEVEQVGGPTEVYRRPSTPFVARFVGQMNFLSAVAAPRSGWARVGAVELRHQPGFEAPPGGALTLAIRPEEIAVGPGALQGDNRLTARITVVQFLGAFTRVGLTVMEKAGRRRDGARVRRGRYGAAEARRGRRRRPADSTRRSRSAPFRPVERRERPGSIRGGDPGRRRPAQAEREDAVRWRWSRSSPRSSTSSCSIRWGRSSGGACSTTKGISSVSRTT